MSLPTSITGHIDATHPSQHLTGFAKLRWAVKNPPIEPNVTFATKTILVTGANTGLGFEAALKYAQKGCAKLILAVRSMQKGEEAKTRILSLSGRIEDDDFAVKVLSVDLASFPSILTFASALETEIGTSGLHIALLNAGLANPTYIASPHGYEMGLQVNVLGTALMAALILPLLRKTARDGRVATHMTFVNSIGHTEVQRQWYTPAPSSGSLLAFANNPALYDQRKSYTSVKLLGMAVMQHFARNTLLPDGSGNSEVIVNACCPFFCRTELGRNFSKPLKVMFGAWQYFTARSAEEGSRTLVGASCLGEGSQGGFWHCDVLYPSGELVNDKKEMERFWGEIREVLERGSGVKDIEKLIKS